MADSPARKQDFAGLYLWVSISSALAGGHGWKHFLEPTVTSWWNSALLWARAAALSCDTATPVPAHQGCANPPDVHKQLLESGRCSVNGLLWQLWHERHIQLPDWNAVPAKLLLCPTVNEPQQEPGLCQQSLCQLLGMAVMLSWVARGHSASLNPCCCASPETLTTHRSKTLTWVIPHILWVFSPSALKTPKSWSGLRLCRYWRLSLALCWLVSTSSI